MNVKEENICRLCLKLAENYFQIIDEITRKMFEVLSLQVNLDVSKDPIICKDCAEVVEKCFNFKSACIDNKQLVYSSAIDKKRATFELKDVYKDRIDIETVDYDSICRFCWNHLSGSDFILLDTLMDDVRFAEMLQQLMPEMDFDIIRNSLICMACKQDLECYVKFVENCLDVEEKITKYLHSEGIPSSTQVRLSEILHISFKNEIKQEVILEDIGEAHCEGYDDEELIKTEEIDLKEEVSEVDKKTNQMLHTKNILEAHIFKCAMCHFETKHKGSLKRHMLVHKDITEVEMYKCSICTYQVKQKPNLKIHMLIHKDIADVETYKCLKCNFETKYGRSLRNHMIIHKHVTEVKMYKCSVCTFETRRKSDFKRHVLIHRNDTDVEMYKCSMCTFETKNKSCLKSHMLVHKDNAEVEMYKCSMCTYETKHKPNLKTHMLIHKDIREVEMAKCSMCTYETRRKSDLKSHMLIHKDSTEVEMYMCTICSYKTKYKSSIKRHKC